MTTKQPAATPIKWADGVDLSTAREILRLAELHMEDQQTLLISGDGRAATLATGMSAVSAGLLIAAVTVLTSDHPPSIWVTIGLLVSSASFLIGAGCALLAGLPGGYWLRGYQPGHLTNAGGDELQLIKWVVEDIHRTLPHNDHVAARAGRMMRASYFAAAAGVALPLIGTIAALIYR